MKYPMKYPSGMLGKKDLTSHDMRKVVMQTSEPVSTREATERLVKILDSTYAKDDLQQVAANTIHMISEDRTELPRLIQDFEYLFDGTIGDWDTDTIDLELNPYYKTVNFKYDLVPRINKDKFLKELQSLVKIGVLPLVQLSQHGNPVFIIRKKIRDCKVYNGLLQD